MEQKCYGDNGMYSRKKGILIYLYKHISSNVLFVCVGEKLVVLNKYGKLH